MCNAKSEKFKTIGQRLNCSQGLNPKNKIGISVSVIKCKNCNLIFSSPRPEPNSINDHYKVDPNKYWKDEYFVIDENYFLYEINTAKKFLKSTRFPKALDIGGGIGKAHISLTKNGFDTTSIEPSETFRNVALNKYNISAEKFLLCSIENAKLKEESFDFITFGAVLEHLNNPSKSINKAMTWLKPGGVIQIEVPSSNHLIAKLYNLFFKLRGTNYVTNLSPMHEPFHMYEFGLRSFKQHAKNNNYEIAKYQYFVCNIYNIPKIFHSSLRYIMKKTNTGMQLSIWLRKI
jgi:2-polyprenyl-3-methyl-5-hydroxy-6-metoxy-1,4-benzoquinol methylase